MRQGRRKFLLEMATGTGKTLLCAALIRRFLITRNAERVLFIVDRIELAKQTMEEFNVVLGEYKPGHLQDRPPHRRAARLVGRRRHDPVADDGPPLPRGVHAVLLRSGHQRRGPPLHLRRRARGRAVLSGDPHRPHRHAEGVPEEHRPRAARDRRTRRRWKPGSFATPTTISDASRASRPFATTSSTPCKDPEGPFLCLPKIIDCRSDITTQALQEAGWTVIINEQEENFKIQDLERKIFTPHRNRVMCEAFLREAQRDPSGELGKSIIFAVNQTHATALTKILNEHPAGHRASPSPRASPMPRRSPRTSATASAPERVAVSVDMLSTGYNCRDLLNVVLMRPIFSPTEYIQIKGRGTRRYTFVVGNTEYEKKHFFLLDFCAVAEYFEEKYDYAVPLKVPQQDGRRGAPARTSRGEARRAQ